MSCTAFFLTLSAARRGVLNRDGWEAHDWSRTYADLRAPFMEKAPDDLVRRALALDLYQPAARLLMGQERAEVAWTALQNSDAPWSKKAGIVALTSEPRSMATGDILLFENETALFCMSIGFEALSRETAAELRAAVGAHQAVGAG